MAMGLDQVRTDGISELFVTPLFRRLYPGAAALNRRLGEIVLERERTAPAHNRSNVGGWQSERDLLEWPHPELATLRDWVVGALKEVTRYSLGGRPLKIGGSLQVMAWANVLRRGNYNRVHNHPGRSWSAVYYVTLGGEPMSDADGLIELVDPRGAANMVATLGRPFDQKVRLRPRAGEMILFPSWLQHYVNPYEGNDVRISIALNISTQNLRLEEAPAAAPGETPGAAPIQ